MIRQWILAVIRPLAPLLRPLGVDPAQFLLMLEIKLKLDSQRRNPAMAQLTGRKKSRFNPFAVTMAIYAFFGGATSLLLLVSDSALVGFTVVHTVAMALVAMALISDYSMVLLDATDHDILAPLPISARTLLAARLAHISIYIGLLVASLTVCSFVTGSIRFGLLIVPAFAATLVLSSCLVVGLVVLVYLAVMRFFDEEKVRDVILWMQMVVSVLTIVGYQLMPRLVDIQQIHRADISGEPWIWFFPPVWLAAPVEIASGQVAAPRPALALLALVVPIAVLAGVIRLGSSFRIRAAAGVHKRGRGVGRIARLGTTLSRWLTRDPEERAAFAWTWHLCSRSRHFKLRTYPGLAVLLLAAVYFIIGFEGSVQQSLAELPETRRYLLLLYFGAMFFPAAIAEMRLSDNPGAAWIYHAQPIARPGRFLLGSLKAAACQFGLPALLFVGGLVLAIWGPAVIPDLLLATSVACVVGLVFARAEDQRAFPFSIPIETSMRTSRQLRMLGVMVLGGLGGLAHWLLTLAPWGVQVAIPIAALSAFLLARHYARTARVVGP